MASAVTGSRIRSAASMRYSSTLSRTRASSRSPSDDAEEWMTRGEEAGCSRSARCSSATTSATAPGPSAAGVCEANTVSVAPLLQATE